MNSRAASSLSGYSMQLIWYRSSKSADRQRPKPARIVPFVVIRIGFGTDWSLDRVASSNSTITPVQPSSSSARCSRSCFGERTTGRPSNRLIVVGLKGGGTAETTSGALEPRRHASGCGRTSSTNWPGKSATCRSPSTSSGCPVSLRSCSLDCNSSTRCD